MSQICPRHRLKCHSTAVSISEFEQRVTNVISRDDQSFTKFLCAKFISYVLLFFSTKMFYVHCEWLKIKLTFEYKKMWITLRYKCMFLLFNASIQPCVINISILLIANNINPNKQACLITITRLVRIL